MRQNALFHPRVPPVMPHVRPLCYALVLLSSTVACSGSAPEETPTPTPTPTPVPPVDEWYRLTILVVGDSEAGVDLDGDGTVDNQIETVLDAAADEIVQTLSASELCNPPVRMSPTVEAPCAALFDAIDAVLSLETLHPAISTPIQSGDVNYLMHLTAPAPVGEATLSWNTGTFQSSHFTSTGTLATQEGEVQADGTGTFGPDDLPLTLTLTSGVTGEDVFTYTLTIQDATVELRYLHTPAVDGVMGGSISAAELDALLAAMLEPIAALICQLDPESCTTPDEEGPFDSVSEVLEPYLDIDTDGDGVEDSVSIGFLLNAGLVTVNE